ncbi:MAG: DUF2752 domain-containing protein [Planctomycetes bacterium]|nr:DUF2752 domain-containing protein [Planctomycetota bacterium]
MAGLALAAASVLGLALRLDPDPRGLGTHEQLGLLPCGFHALTGLPCPSCGMTTAFALAVRGRLGPAFLAQPAGALLYAATALGGTACALAAAVGYPLLGQVHDRLPWRASVLAGLGVLVGSWGWTVWRHAVLGGP